MKIFKLGLLLDFLPCAEPQKKFLGRAASVIAANVFILLICRDTVAVSIASVVAMSYCNWIYIVRLIIYGWYVCEACGRLKCLSNGQRDNVPHICHMCDIRIAGYEHFVFQQVTASTVAERNTFRTKPPLPPVVHRLYPRQ
jgi:hypothetical protein